ncbi:342_t:CDS:2 [Cetraspora pellucida]|uniref:342_t:CDS:1 n=1 Tax=Cetraspora pellucida TaxID=1433469 RepID=A0A9N9NWY1_9GLOM|nr:342_t:CDS:2 [Cetraspora pellucida]
MNRLVKLEKNTNIIEYLDELLKISEALKHNQLFTSDSSNLFSQNLNTEREICKNYINDNGPIQLEEIAEIETPENLEIFNKLKIEIEIIDMDIILNLFETENELYKKIINSKLSQEKINKLINFAQERINKFEQKQYNDFNNIINNLNIIKDLNNLNDEISSDKYLSDNHKKLLLSTLQHKKNDIQQNSEFEFLNKIISEEKDINKLESNLKTAINESSLNDKQKEKLEKLKLEKIENLKPTEKPESILFDELKKQIENIDLSNAEKLFDGNDLYQTIINSNLPSNDIDNLENLRNKKLKQLINKQYNQFEDSLNSLESEEDLKSLKNQVINNKLLLKNQKDNFKFDKK